MRRLGLLLAVMLTSVLAGAGGMAATPPAGTAVGVNPAASDVGKTTRTLVVGADVVMGDKIVTGPSGQVQLIFSDQTHLVVGPGSSLVIASYLMRNDQTASRFAINALGGSFRFVTGQSDHNAYTITTPTGTIGVRGTAFDFVIGNAVTPGHAPGTAVALFRGAVQLCDLGGKCVLLTKTCDLGGTSPDEAYLVSHSDAAAAGARTRFRYIANERPLLPAFRIPQSRLCYINNNSNQSLAPLTDNGGNGVPTVTIRRINNNNGVPVNGNGNGNVCVGNC